jgi:F-type H+/Na+-transporting ATPase subunit beta
MNAVGEPIDDMGKIETSLFLPMHKVVNPFLDQARVGEMLVTGIKVFVL